MRIGAGGIGWLLGVLLALTSPARAADDGLSLQRGRETLRPCDIGSASSGLATVAGWCGTVRVPEDWEHPQGRQLSLRIALVRAEIATPAADVIAFLDGGPGGAATDDYPQIAGALQLVHQRHDVLLMDQRGTGGSNPLNCQTAARHPDAIGEGAAAIDVTRHWLEQCLRDLAPRAAVEHYTTTQTTHDLEAVRSALAIPTLDLVAVSYGTRLAQQFVARYPRSVRTVVLDSVVPNRLALLSEHARNLEQTLRAMAGRCRAEAACAARFGDPYATLYRLRDRLQAAPRTVEVRDAVTYVPLHLRFTADDLAAVVRFYSYSPVTTALLPLMLAQADQGDFAPLLGQKKWLADDLGDRISGGLELSVVCSEDVDLLKPRIEDAHTLLGNAQIDAVRMACQQWPHEARPASFHQPLHSDLPALVLAGEFDPVTPPAYAREVIATLPHARLLIAPAQGHAVLSSGCIPQLLAQFIDRAGAEGLDATCLARLGPVPAFLDYNGSAP